MSADSAVLLAVTWSWGAGFMGLLLLGVLLPLGVCVLELTLLLWLQRRDWRLVPGGAGVVVVFLVAGTVMLTGVRPPAPGLDYWIALSASVGAVVLGAGTLLVLAHARRRFIDDRIALALLQEPAREDVVRGDLPRPRAVPRLNAVSAEHLVGAWMRHLGAYDAIVTPSRRDGGVDVRSTGFVAQVKHRADLIPVHQVRELAGAAARERRAPLFFTTGNFSRDSLAFARESRMALFIVRYREGDLKAANPLAQQLLLSGLASTTDGARAASAYVDGTEAALERQR